MAVTVDWAIPRFMPGDPVQGLIARMRAQPEATDALTGYYTKAFGLDVPLWKQYLNFWVALFHGDLGRSIWQFPRPVTSLILHAAPYTLACSCRRSCSASGPATRSARSRRGGKVLDNTVLPVGYVLTATPYMWLAIVIAYVFGSVTGVFPLSGAYAYSMQPGWTFEFFKSYGYHWFLPFMSLFLVGFGGWAIGMRNMIIYELESDYSHYLEALGAPTRLVRRYAYRNAVAAADHRASRSRSARSWPARSSPRSSSPIPGLGSLILSSIQNRDYFLLQGIFLFIIVGVLIANFLVDVAYVIVDPRTRIGMQGGRA